MKMTNTQVSEPMSHYNQGQTSDLFRAEDSKPHTSRDWLIFSGGLVSPKREENTFSKPQLQVFLKASQGRRADSRPSCENKGSRDQLHSVLNKN